MILTLTIDDGYVEALAASFGYGVGRLGQLPKETTQEFVKRKIMELVQEQVVSQSVNKAADEARVTITKQFEQLTVATVEDTTPKVKP